MLSPCASRRERSRRLESDPPLHPGRHPDAANLAGLTASAWPARSLIAAGIVLFGSVALVASAKTAEDVAVAWRSGGAVPIVLSALALAAVSATVVLMARIAVRRPDRELHLIGAGLVLVVVVRLATAFLIDAPVDRDMRYYDTAAAGILGGACCFESRPMGYPLLLAGAYGVIGRGALAGEALNILAALAGAILLAAVARRWFGGAAASVAIALYACWPAAALMTTARMSETVYSSQLVMAVATAALGGTGWRWGTITGAMIGLSQYVRATSIALVPAFGLARIVGRGRSARAIAADVAALVLSSLLILVPVAVHNLRAHRELSVQTHSYGGLSLWQGTDQGSGGRFSIETWEAYPHLSPGDLWEDGKVAARLGTARIVEDPIGFLGLQLQKFPFTWGSEDYGILFAFGSDAPSGPRETFARILAQGFYAAVAVLATVTLWARRRLDIDPLTALAIGLSVITAGIHVFLEARERYHMYVVPLILALAAIGITTAVASRAGSATTRSRSLV